MRTNFLVPRFYAGGPIHSVITFSVSGIESFMPFHLREVGRMRNIKCWYVRFMPEDLCIQVLFFSHKLTNSLKNQNHHKNSQPIHVPKKED